MSRKWERMVEKNRKQVNQQREKHGKTKVQDVPESNKTEFRGRSLIISIILLSVSLIFGITMFAAGDVDGLYWFTLISYFLLSLYFFYLKRPYLGIGKNQLYSRKMGGIRQVDAEDVAKIKYVKDVITIKFKGKQLDWSFSRRANLFNTDEMMEHLEKFAVKHQIPVDK